MIDEFGIGEGDGDLIPPGEQLTIELVPSTSWGVNLRSALKRSDWDRLRRQCYQEAGHHCEVCRGRGRRHPVECHEVWSYDEVACIQKLERLIALCPACHEVKHFGLATRRGRGRIALDHLARVNKWSFQRSHEYVVAAFRVWEQRSVYPWTLDLTWLEDRGIRLRERPR